MRLERKGETWDVCEDELAKEKEEEEEEEEERERGARQNCKPENDY